MDEKNHSRSNNAKKDDHNKQARDIGRNQRKWHQRTQSDQSVGKGQ